MKYKERPPKNNLILMFFIMSALIFVSVGFLILKKYSYFLFYLTASIILIYSYLFTYYFLEKDYLLIKLGFVKVKIEYKNILSISETNEKLVIFTKKNKFNLYPNPKDKFIKELNKKLDDKVTINGKDK